MLSVNIETAQVTGRGKACLQDVVYTRSTEDGFSFIGMADGQTFKEECVRGGRGVLSELADVLQEMNISAIGEEKLPAIKAKIYQRISLKLKHFAEFLGQETEITEFSSTVVAVALNRNTKDLLLIHLGDGKIEGIKNGARMTLSGPDNGVTRKHTWFTTSCSAYAHLRIRKGSATGFQGVLLSSDGAEKVRMELAELPCEEWNEDIFRKLLEDAEPEDDATLVYISLTE